MRKLAVTPLSKILAAITLACTLASSAWAQDRPRVVAVNYPLSYLAERLLGDAAEVVFPVPSDVDPSFWRPTIADISMIQSADLILLNGAGFATWVDRVSLPRGRIVNTTDEITDRFIKTESITHSHGDGGEHSHEGVASYTWLDPSLAMAQAEAVARAIIARDLAAEAEVNARLDALLADLEALSALAQSSTAEAAGLAFVATHPRYQYLARAYGLQIDALEWEAGETPDDAQMAALAELVDENGARILIWEAEPDAVALEATAKLGLVNVTFNPLAQPPSEGDLLSGFDEAWSDLSDAVSQATNE